MPLVRIEVENFKSYRGKQIIGPFRHFNSVIGPNGSGKSNLMDAISFVLGVKSNQLRSSQLKDLIYRGRQLQEGQEAQSEESDDEGQEGEGTARKASVTAVIQTKDQGEVQFTRSITLAGASEYRVNGRALSASAYNDRLRSLNILVKAKNFLVFQGDVEAVASQNPKELSRLIDQISGSLEHKEAYERAKLADERARSHAAFVFNKRRTMTSELRHFKEQKNEADRFKRAQKERDALIVRHTLWRLYHIDRRLRELVSTIDKGNKNLPSLRSQVDEETENLETLRQEHGEIVQEILNEQRSMRKREKELEKIQPEIDGTDQKLAHSQKKQSSSEDIVRAVKGDIQRYQNAIAKYTADYEAAKEAADRAAEEQRRASAAQGLRLSEADLRQYRQLREEANMRVPVERRQLETLSLTLRTQRGKLQTVQDKLTAAQTQKEKLEAEVASLQSSKEKGDQRVRQLESDLAAARASVRALQNEKQRVNSRMTELNATLQACLQQLVEAGQAQRETEKEARTREAIASLRRLYPGVMGRLMDLCKPTQRKYDAAVQVVLGKNAEAIVVETQKEAIECIEYLKRQRIGLATFIPLNSAQVKEVNERLRSIAPGARLAIDILEYNANVDRAIRYACGNSLICDTMDIARDVVYNKRQQVKAVTLEGTVIHKNGMITGGRGNEVSGTRWQEKEVQALHRQRDDLMAELKSLGAQQYELSRSVDGTSKIVRYEAELTSANDDLKATTTRLTGIEAELAALNRSLTSLESQKADAQKQIDEQLVRTSDLQRTIDTEDDAVFADFCRRIGVQNIREYEEGQLRLMQQQSDARAEYELQMKRLEHAKQFEETQLQSAETRLAQNERVLERERQRQVDLQTARDAQEEKLGSIREAIRRLREQIDELKEREAQSKAQLSSAKSAMQKAQSALDGALKDISAANLEIERLADDRTSIYRRCRLEEINLPLERGSLSKVPLEDSQTDMNLDEEESTPIPAAASDYGLRVNFSSLSSQEKRDGSEEAAKEFEERIETTNAELERMSAPNAKMIERLGDTEARLADADDEFERARSDAKRAHDEYLRVRKLRCDLYHSAFEHISGKVDEVYKDLTRNRAAPKGGNAYLDLQNETEPYLEGVLYTAMPPTKSFRGIDQLSGGEKSVAALALLFAVHSFQPAPFFVLDEVDAALDAQNVSRVANYIRSRASADFQFIVISLKATLYEKSEALLGVMRKQDINSSRTLTLDLEQYA